MSRFVALGIITTLTGLSWLPGGRGGGMPSAGKVVSWTFDVRTFGRSDVQTLGE